jgi:hypothetical protein
MKTNRYWASGLAIVMLGPLFIATAAHADSVSIVLTNASESGAKGSSLTFDATLLNLTNATIFLNGDSSATTSPSLTVDDAPFLANFPLTLGPHASSGPFALFNVLIVSNTLPGTYNFNSFSLLGGNAGTVFSTLGTAQFSVTVKTAASVPEPNEFLLVLFTSLFLGACFRVASMAVR